MVVEHVNPFRCLPHHPTPTLAGGDVPDARWEALLSLGYAPLSPRTRLRVVYYNAHTCIPRPYIMISYGYCFDMHNTKE